MSPGGDDPPRSPRWDPLSPSPWPAGPAPPPRRILAVDLGLRAGLAELGPDGRLLRYRSTNFGTVERLKRAIPGVLDAVPDLARLVVEGDRRLAERWIREAERRSVPAVAVAPEAWREALFGHQPATDRAKAQADTAARRVIAWSGCARPTSLRHDAAEAILIGLWGALDAGWIAPAEVAALALGR